MRSYAVNQLRVIVHTRGYKLLLLKKLKVSFSKPNSKIDQKQELGNLFRNYKDSRVHSNCS